jgi:DNA-binding NtrC family response regulator
MDMKISNLPGMLGFSPKPMSRENLLMFLRGQRIANKKSISMKNVLRDQKISSKPIRVLIVDDDDALRLNMKMIINRVVEKKVKYLECDDVLKALDIIKNNDLDIILSDINLMTDLNGFDLLEMSQLYLKKTRFYFISGYSRSEMEAKALDAGADGYLQLPIEEYQIKDILK